MATRREGTRELTDRDLKIVEALYRLMPDQPRVVTYEDIVVKAWQLYPDDFGLRGYSESYPDASDIHKPLYNALRTRGWVSTGPPGQKKFTLTPQGWERARAQFEGRAESSQGSGRASRTTEVELEYLERTEAAALYDQGKAQDILDTDFYAFYRTSVRATPQNFERRLAEVSLALDEAVEKQVPLAEKLREVDAFLRERFADHIEVKTQRKRR